MNYSAPHSAESWPIAAALLQFPAVDRSGRCVQEQSADEWSTVFGDVKAAGFDLVDLTDVWLRPGDLSATRLDELATVISANQLAAPSISTVRRSVIDAGNSVGNLAYLHRTIDAAAHLGSSVVSLGLHQDLTEAQRKQLWFWTVPGYRDPIDDADVKRLVVQRFQELGNHAEEVGVMLSLELYEDTFLGTADSAVELVESIDRASVGLNPDVGNLIRLHRPIEAWQDVLAKTLPYANYWHVKNYARDEDPGTGSYHAVPASLESGLINYREAFGLAAELGFHGVICTEHYGGDGLSVSATNQRYLRSCVLPSALRRWQPARSRVARSASNGGASS